MLVNGQKIGSVYGVDVVFEATTSVECLKLAVDMLKTEGKLIVFGTHPQPISIQASTFKEKSCVVYYTFPTKSEWLPYTKKGLELLATRAINVESLVTHRFKLEDINNAFELIEKKTLDVMKIIIQP